MLLVWTYTHLAWQLPAWLQTPDWYRPLTKFVLHFIRLNQAVGLFGVIFVEELGIPLPVPGDVAIAWAGYLTSAREIAEWQAILAVVAGATLGSTCLYTLSRRFGHPFVMRFGRYVGLNQESFLRVEAAFKRWGPWAIIFGRHIPGMRIYLSALAGVFEVPALVFIPCVAVSSTAWALIFVTVGRLLGRQSGRLARLLPAHLLPYAVGVIIILCFVLVALAHGWHPFHQRSPKKADNPTDTAATKTPAELHKT